MRKVAVALILVTALAGCRRVQVSFPIPVRLSGTVTIDGVDPVFADSVIVLADLLASDIDESTEEDDSTGIGVDMESIVIVVSRNECQENTLVEGHVDVRLEGGDPKLLATITRMNLTDVFGDTLNVDLDTAGVNLLNQFAQDAMEGIGSDLWVIVEGQANPGPPPDIDFDLDVVLSFTLVVSREMVSIGL